MYGASCSRYYMNSSEPFCKIPVENWISAILDLSISTCSFSDSLKKYYFQDILDDHYFKEFSGFAATE